MDFLMLSLALISTWTAYLGKNRGQSRDQFAVLVFEFGAACSLITAISRVNLNAAIDSRYLIIPIICLIASMYLISAPRIRISGFNINQAKYAMSLSIFSILIAVSFYNYGKAGIQFIKNVNVTGPLTAELKLAEFFSNYASSRRSKPYK